MKQKIRNQEDIVRKSAEKVKGQEKPKKISLPPKEFMVKVAEAVEDDAERHIARIDAEILNAVGIHDFIDIKGSKTALVQALPAYLGDRGLKIIRIDKKIREECGANIGDLIRVKIADFEVAEVIEMYKRRKPQDFEVMPQKSEKLFESFIKSQFEQLENEVKAAKNLDELTSLGNRIEKLRLAFSDDVLVLYVMEKARLLKMIEDKTGGAIKLRRD